MSEKQHIAVITCPLCKGHGAVVLKCCITHDESEPCWLCRGERKIDPDDDQIKRRMRALKRIVGQLT